VAFVLVVEKECVFHRLVEDGVHERARCAVVTGKGMPDLAARAATWRITAAFSCPAVALTDCNPSGLSVALAYKLPCRATSLPSADEVRFSEPGGRASGGPPATHRCHVSPPRTAHPAAALRRTPSPQRCRTSRGWACRPLTWTA